MDLDIASLEDREGLVYILGFPANISKEEMDHLTENVHDKLDHAYVLGVAGGIEKLDKLDAGILIEKIEKEQAIDALEDMADG